jgi:proline dehydrogenase
MKDSHTSGPFADAALSSEEVTLVENMYERIHTVASLAAEKDVRLMIDAEQTYFQPAIDHATLELQHKHNKVFPTIFGTYQCYLKDTPSRVIADLDRARKYGYLFAAKIVRGAYMKIERDRAAAMGYPSPICDTLQDTHDSFHRVMQYILDSKNRNLVVASHNQSSIEIALEYMRKNNIDPATGGVYFAQLLGMADHLTFSLGRNGYKAYKYVPYGPVHEVVPYLIRRAQENGDLIGGSAHKEISMAKHEIFRFVGPKFAILLTPINRRLF